MASAPDRCRTWTLGVLVAAVALAGCLASEPEAAPEDEAPRFVGTGSMAVAPDTRYDFVLGGHGWMRVDLTFEQETRIEMEVLHRSSSEPLTGDGRFSDWIGPGMFVDAHLVKTENGAGAPYGLFVLGLPQAAREATIPEQGVVVDQSGRPAEPEAGETWTILVGANAPGLTVRIEPGDGVERTHEVPVMLVPHEGLVYGPGVPQAYTTVDQELVQYGNRLEFRSDRAFEGLGAYRAVTWEVAEAGPHVGVTNFEAGAWNETNGCSSAGGRDGVYVNEADPVSLERSLAYLTTGWFQAWPGSYELCGMVEQTSVGPWERVAAGAWFLFVPHAAPEIGRVQSSQ